MDKQKILADLLKKKMSEYSEKGTPEMGGEDSGEYEGSETDNEVDEALGFEEGSKEDEMVDNLIKKLLANRK